MKFKINNKNIEVRKIKSLLGKFHGLMFSKKKNLMFIFDKEESVPLHMMFVFFPIIVLYLNKEKEIVEKTLLKPFRFYNPKHKAKFVVEIASIDKKTDLKEFFKNIKIKKH